MDIGQDIEMRNASADNLLLWRGLEIGRLGLRWREWKSPIGGSFGSVAALEHADQIVPRPPVVEPSVN
jgi:hypothetical protein